jgi:hypothetical protein
MKTLWGIRHLRFYFWQWKFWRWWEAIGHHLGACPNPADLEFLEDVWQGKR